jgi:hypothetical protein
VSASDGADLCGVRATVIDDINFNPEFMEPYLEQTVQLVFKVCIARLR